MACQVCHFKNLQVNEKLFSVAGQIVMHKYGRCLDKSDRIAKKADC